MYNVVNMKKLLFIPLLFVVASCSPQGIINSIETFEKDVKIYSAVTDEDFSYQDELTFRCKKGEGEVLYASLPMINQIYSPYIKDGFYTEVSSNKFIVRDNNEKAIYFYLEINGLRDTFIVAGDMSNVMMTINDYSKSTLSTALAVTDEVISQHNNVYTYSYKNTGYDDLTINFNYYLPLSLLSLIFRNCSPITMFYNYSFLSLVSEYDFLSDRLCGNVTPFADMASYINDNLNRNMPEYIKNDKIASLRFIFNNFYGLKNALGISDMNSFMDASSDFAKIVNAKDLMEATEGLYTFIANLDDGHSTVYPNSKSPWQAGMFSRFGSKWRNRLNIRNELISDRNNKINAPYVMDLDKSLGFITIDGFSFMDNGLDKDGKPVAKAYEEDTFFYLVKHLNIFKENNVRDVVIDLSTNTGGVVGVLFKMLAVLSKNNKVYGYEYLENIDALIKLTIACDSNLDGTFDTNDVYGNDMNFYLLTSEVSYSCGNAYPYWAKKNQVAKIIGQTSGGGECAVNTLVLPTGELISISSLTHLGFAKGDAFEGDEGGTSPDIYIPFDSYYDLDKLYNYISRK